MIRLGIEYVRTRRPDRCTLEFRASNRPTTRHGAHASELRGPRGAWRSQMKGLFALALVTALLRCGPGGAQTDAFGAPPAPGFGTTSSLGTLITAAPVGGTAIPLGSA